MRSIISMAIVLAAILQSPSFCQGNDQIKIALYARYSGKLPFDVFCQKAINNGYNYVAAWSDFGSPNGKYQRQYLINLFNIAGHAGVRLIPMVPICAGSSYGIKERSGNPHIELNLLKPALNRSSLIGCHEFAPKINGMDSTFLVIVREIKAALDNAVQYRFPLDYILVNHDEFAYAWEEVMMIGGGPPWMNWKNDATTYSKSDRKYIDSLMGKGYTITSAFNHLIVAEMYRRLVQIQEVFPSVKMMIFGDSFDPDCHGGFPLYTYLSKDTSDHSHSVKLTPQIAVLPGLHTDQKIKFKKDVVLIPWSYNIKAGTYAQCRRVNPTDTMRFYNAAGTFAYLDTNGFSFLYHCAIPGPNRCAYSRDRLAEGMDMMHRFVAASRYFPKSCVGYSCAFYDTTDTDVSIMDSLAAANAAE